MLSYPKQGPFTDNVYQTRHTPSQKIIRDNSAVSFSRGQNYLRT